MTEGQILLDCRAYIQMLRPSSQVVERYKGALRHQPNGNQFEDFLKVRYVSTQCLDVAPAIDVKKVVMHELFLWKAICPENDDSP